MNPEFSVVIPSYNHEKYIGGATESVINQTFTDWELIIVDDGSIDNSVEIIKKYKDPRIKLFTQTNHDAPYTINRGMKEARGKYIAILNSDDLFEPIKLEECHKYLKEGNDFVFGKLKIIDEKSHLMSEKDERVIWINNRLSDSEEHTLAKLLLNVNYYTTTSNFAFNKNIIEKVGYFHEKLHIAHDFNYLLRIFEKGLKIKFIPEYLTSYRLHSSNTISKGKTESYLEASYAITKLFRNNPNLAKSLPLDFFQVPIFSNTLLFYSTLSDEEIEDAVSNKESAIRKKILVFIKKLFRGGPYFQDIGEDGDSQNDFESVIKKKKQEIMHLNKNLYEIRTSLRWKVPNYIYKKMKKIRNIFK